MPRNGVYKKVEAYPNPLIYNSNNYNNSLTLPNIRG